MLRTLTEEERSARAHALADARVREAEERKIAEEDARRRAGREASDRAEREAADARKRDEDARRASEEETKRKAEQEARKRFGDAEAARAGVAGVRTLTPDEDEDGPRTSRRGKTAVAPRPARTPAGNGRAAAGLRSSRRCPPTKSANARSPRSGAAPSA